jgi:mannosyltransferase
MSLKKISITLDSGILGLQKYGGISNYWNRLIENIRYRSPLQATLLLPKNIVNLDFDKTLVAEMNCNEDKFHNRVSRYLEGRVKPGCDIFHSSYYRLPNSGRCRYIVTVYDFIYERYDKGVSRWVHSFQKERALGRADAIICISESTRQDALRFFPWLDPSNVHVVYLAVDHKRFYPDSKSEDSALHDTVLWVGQRGGHKRFDLAVATLSYHDDLKLGIVGPELTKQEITLLDTSCSDRWVYLGAVNEARLRQIYSSVFALIYPSDYEGFGLPILEAMACGCPVLAANTSSLPEVGGEAAVYAYRQNPLNYSDKLNFIKSDRPALVNLGIDRAKLFTWEKTFNETVSIYVDQASNANLKKKH